MLNLNKFKGKTWMKPLIMVISIVVIIIAGVIGKHREAEYREDRIIKHFNDNTSLEYINENIYIIDDQRLPDSIFHLGISSFQGYSGPIEMAVKVSQNGEISDLFVISQKETPSYFKKVMRAKFTKQFIGKSYQDSLILDKSIEAVSGATVSSNAITEATKNALYLVSDQILELPIPPPPPTKILFGPPEIALVGLYILVLIGLTIARKIKKTIRWISLISGIIILGFWLSIPLSLSKINSFLLGYWPDWHSNLYWYMLIISVFGLTLIKKKNYYCHWFCPFGAAQEILGLIGGAKFKLSKSVRVSFLVFQRLLLWSAISLAFFYRTPSKLNYEVFGPFFNLTGASLLFVLTIIFILAAMFTDRPWCKLMCPINGITDFLTTLRKVIVKQKLK